MEGTTFMYIFSFIMFLKVLGFTFFKPGVCSRCGFNDIKTYNEHSKFIDDDSTEEEPEEPEEPDTQGSSSENTDREQRNQLPRMRRGSGGLYAADNIEKMMAEIMQH